MRFSQERGAFPSHPLHICQIPAVYLPPSSADSYLSVLLQHPAQDQGPFLGRGGGGGSCMGWQRGMGHLVQGGGCLRCRLCWFRNQCSSISKTIMKPIAGFFPDTKLLPGSPVQVQSFPPSFRIQSVTPLLIYVKSLLQFLLSIPLCSCWPSGGDNSPVPCQRPAWHSLCPLPCCFWCEKAGGHREGEKCSGRPPPRLGSWELQQISCLGCINPLLQGWGLVATASRRKPELRQARAPARGRQRHAQLWFEAAACGSGEEMQFSLRIWLFAPWSPMGAGMLGSQLSGDAAVPAAERMLPHKKGMGGVWALVTSTTLRLVQLPVGTAGG